MSDHVKPWAPLTPGELTESKKNSRKNTDDVDTEEIPQQAGGARAYQAALREQVERLRKQLAEAKSEQQRAVDDLHECISGDNKEIAQLREQLAKATTERDRLKLNLASTQGGVLGW
jgi:predicted RNase H-like nuclease (RuvC/YqgF family)